MAPAGGCLFTALSLPMPCPCIPQKQTHHTAMLALRKGAPVSASFDPERVGHAPFATMAANSVRTSSTKASTSAKASQEAGAVLAERTTVPIECWLMWS